VTSAALARATSHPLGASERVGRVEAEQLDDSAAGGVMQRPLSSHAAGYAQSVTSLQPCPHLPAPHAYGAHDTSEPLSRSVSTSLHTAPEMHAPVGRSQPKPSAQSVSTTHAVAQVRLVPSQR
jgi:hypothetical protein